MEEMSELDLGTPPASVAGALGRAIQRLRKFQGIKSQAEFASETGEGASVLAKIESGARVPTKEVWEAIATALTSVDPQHLKTLNDLWWLARNQEDPMTARTVPWAVTESQAHTLRYWAPLLMPGLVQTADYARTLFLVWGHDRNQIDDLVGERMKRRALLDGSDAPDVTMVLWEPVLRSLVGSAEIMREQLAQLLEISERPGIHIHVLPSKVGAHMGLGGQIDLATTDTAEMLLMEGFSENVLTADKSQVKRASATFNSVRADGLSQTESREVISEAMEAWNTHIRGESPHTAPPQGTTGA